MGDASAVQITKFFVYQAGVTLLGAVVMLAESSYFIERFGNIVIVSVLSFAVHLLIMAFMVAVVFAPGLIRRLCHFLVRLCVRTFSAACAPFRIPTPCTAGSTTRSTPTRPRCAPRSSTAAWWRPPSW